MLDGAPRARSGARRAIFELEQSAADQRFGNEPEGSIEGRAEAVPGGRKRLVQPRFVQAQSGRFVLQFAAEAADGLTDDAARAVGKQPAGYQNREDLFLGRGQPGKLESVVCVIVALLRGIIGNRRLEPVAEPANIALGRLARDFKAFRQVRSVGEALPLQPPIEPDETLQLWEYRHGCCLPESPLARANRLSRDERTGPEMIENGVMEACR